MIRRAVGSLVMLAGLGAMVPAAGAEEVFVTPVLSAPRPPCQEGTSRWTVAPWSLTFAREDCVPIGVPKAHTLVLFMVADGGQSDRCDHAGGVFELIGDPDGFNLNVCWGADK